jgi:hypothetical protein
MTENEIIKALECCNSTERGHCLNKCPYYNYSANCTQSMINDALDFINRQKAEIERLRKAIKVQDIMIEQQDYKLKQAKSEAIKEFAELVKMEFYKEFDELIPSIMADRIDNLVKEMTEV